jgi:hypothetical protein
VEIDLCPGRLEATVQQAALIKESSMNKGFKRLLLFNHLVVPDMAVPNAKSWSGVIQPG